MLFNKKIKPGDYEVKKEGREDVMYFNYDKYPHTPSIEEDPFSMSRVIDGLVQSPSTSRIVFNQKRNYEYGYNQTQMLVEISQIYNHFVKQKNILSYESMGPDITDTRDFAERQRTIQYIILNLLRTDPIGSYIELVRIIRDENIRLKKAESEGEIFSIKHYLSLLNEIYSLLENTKLIAFAKPYISGYNIGNREVYRNIFRPLITPDFMYTRLMAEPPMDGEELDAYSLSSKVNVNIFNTPRDIKPLYHVTPPEFKISEDKYELIDLARNVLSEHQPKAQEFLDPEKMRVTFFNIGRDLLTELASHRKMTLSYDELNELAEILVRYTVGFGLIEVLLQDQKIQDIMINGPIGQTPVFIVHQDHEECVTNIIPSEQDGESWASKLRLISARPLDEANPVLDTELVIPDARARVAAITRPLNPTGLAFAIRRHRDKPWTLALFVKNNMISPLGAGLLSFLIDGARTILVAGTRGSGKTSVLGSVLVEIMRKYRIITIEDTLELPVDSLRDLGYNIQPMKVRSALVKAGAEISADEGIRTSLRLGDSSLIVGEIRSLEAFALYEAMRIGALANVVAGTIHGDSPYGVFDRVVNDLKVPRTSFKATDIIIVANPVKSADGLHKFRRVTQITEVRKEWEDDPLAEEGFVDLMKYDPKQDKLIPTDHLLNGDSQIVKSIAGNIREWAGNWDAVWDNIILRAKMKETLVEYANRLKDNDLLEAKSVIFLNDEFHKITDRVKEKLGYPDTKQIFNEWEESLKRYIKKR